MSGKDFRLIASTISELPLGEHERTIVARKFADDLRKVNPSFDRPLFLAACRVEEA